MNQITVVFSPCSPAPENGYNIKWRVLCSGDPYTDAGNFMSSPAVFNDELNPEGTCYEGTIQSDCGGSGDPVLGREVHWSTPCEQEESGNVYAFLVRVGDGTAAICNSVPMLVYSASPIISIGAFIYFDNALTMPVDTFYYVVEGNMGTPGIIYIVSTSGEIVSNSG